MLTTNVKKCIENSEEKEIIYNIKNKKCKYKYGIKCNRLKIEIYLQN